MVSSNQSPSLRGDGSRGISPPPHERLFRINDDGERAELLAGDPSPPSRSTLNRWIDTGKLGVYLEFSVKNGGAATSREALDRFYRRVAEARVARKRSRGGRKSTRDATSAGKQAAGEAQSRLDAALGTTSARASKGRPEPEPVDVG